MPPRQKLRKNKNIKISNTYKAKFMISDIHSKLAKYAKKQDNIT